MDNEVKLNDLIDRITDNYSKDLDKMYLLGRANMAKEILQELYYEAKERENQEITMFASQIKDIALRHYGIEVDE